ncbi:hypothetical protein FLP10_15700 [Agromyces intestinalis]|uniref:Tetratricopeptide repeat protein n=1 Tax=Agromyces intestinalis TaxID=2592652 RepID=A0A5C1YJQ5_9MICO|nr:hypothetical protein [Agromyces intestinalis]QEO15705.1 hypothetical protein FLP10_15700 [Agromyces intestinalis]
MDDTTEQVHADPARHRGYEQRAIDRLWDFADPIASEARFRAAAADESTSPHLRAVMATQVARALGIQRRTAEALEALDRIDTTEAGGDPAETAELDSRVELERGRLLADAGRIDEALAALTRAVRGAVHAGSTFLALDAVHMLALHDAGHEQEWAEQGLELLAAERDPRVLRWGVALHNNLGWTLHDGGDAEAGLAQFELAVAAADRFGSLEQQQVARWSVGRALRSLGRIEEALAVQRELVLVRPDDPWVRVELDALAQVDDAAQATASGAASAAPSGEASGGASRVTEAGPTIEA